MEKSVLVLVIYQVPTFNKKKNKKWKRQTGMLKWQIFSRLLLKEWKMPLRGAKIRTLCRLSTHLKYLMWVFWLLAVLPLKLFWNNCIYIMSNLRDGAQSKYKFQSCYIFIHMTSLIHVICTFCFVLTMPGLKLGFCGLWKCCNIRAISLVSYII